MHFKSTLQKMGGYLRKSFVIFLLSVCAMSTNAQTTISVESGTGYTGLLGIVGGNAAITFGIQNSNASVRTLTGIDMTWDPFFTAGATDATLWYTTSSLSGPPTITTPTWTQLATASLNITTGGIIPTFTGLSFTLAANTEYRFAVSSTNGVGYSPAAATPNVFSADGVSLRTNNFQIGGLNTGYSGAFPSPGNNPRAFTGRIIFVNPAPPCTGTPDPGNTLASVATICPGLGINLSLQNSIPGSGVTYQWQRSTTGVGGPYTNIAGATNTTLTTSQTVATHYRCAVTCSGFTGNSTPAFVDMAPPANCYCNAGSTDVDPTFEKIDNVKFGTLNNPSTSFVGYEDFTAVPPPSFAAGVTAPITVTGNGNTYPGDIVRVWIDFNQNGNFNDAGELVYTSPQSAGPYTGNITFPGTATVGTTRMRIRMYDNIFGNGNATACGDNTYGQVEDYTVNITPCIPGAISAQPANASVACGGFKTFSVTATGTALTYQWQERASATAPWTIVNNGGIYSGATTATLALSGVSAASNGHQFQVAVGGPCTPVFLSSVATLTVTPYQAPISPVPAIYCAGSSLQIFASPPPAVTTVCSGTLNLHITDGAIAGVNNTLNVSGIPAGAVISKVEVKLNVVHPYVSDLEVVVKGPNGQVLNLSNLIGGTNDPYEDFTNTVFTSDPAAPALVTGTSPGFTGTFKPDRAGAVGAFGVPGGPTGFLPTFPANTGSLIDLAGTNPNGAWTIAMYDAGPPDEGDLINWCVSITWGVTPATGIFSPVTNLWLDAGLSVPYTGTAVNSVYTNAPASTVYTAVVNNGICNATVDIPVTVAKPLTNLVNPANKSVCIGGTTSFTATATGGPFSYAWEVSTDGGTTWTPVSNGGVYSGATTGTLTLSNVPATFEGNQYRATLNVATCATSATSGAATLTVNALPVVTLTTSNNGQLYPGLSTTITAAVAPNAASYQWYRDGVLIPGATGSTLRVDVDGAGDYTVAVTDINGCSNTSSAVTIINVPNDILFIYPSPNSGQFQVRYFNTLGNSSNVRTLNIYDSKGSRVYSKSYDINQPYTKMDVDMSNYSKGIYRVELGDRNGKRIKTGSVLIQ